MSIAKQQIKQRVNATLTRMGEDIMWVRKAGHEALADGLMIARHEYLQRVTTLLDAIPRDAGPPSTPTKLADIIPDVMVDLESSIAETERVLEVAKELNLRRMGNGGER